MSDDTTVALSGFGWTMQLQTSNSVQRDGWFEALSWLIRRKAESLSKQAAKEAAAV